MLCVFIFITFLFCFSFIHTVSQHRWLHWVLLFIHFVFVVWLGMFTNGDTSRINLSCIIVWIRSICATSITNRLNLCVCIYRQNIKTEEAFGEMNNKNNDSSHSLLLQCVWYICISLFYSIIMMYIFVCVLLSFIVPQFSFVVYLFSYFANRRLLAVVPSNGPENVHKQLQHTLKQYWLISNINIYIYIKNDAEMK